MKHKDRVIERGNFIFRNGGSQVSKSSRDNKGDEKKELSLNFPIGREEGKFSIHPNGTVEIEAKGVKIVINEQLGLTLKWNNGTHLKVV